MSEFKDKLEAFLQHFEKLNELGEDAESGYNAEFMQLKQETQHYKENNTFPAEAGQQPYNKKKNRFKDILPYEYTRVQLHKAEGLEGSDYINANYIQGADSSVTYIAAQGPLPHTVEDFWRMLWYHQIEIVVMACKLVELGRKKCEQYWPSLGESQMFGAIKVTMTNEESISDDFTVRELIAECQGETQTIRQYHYSAWPDHGRPNSALPIIRMIERIGDHRKRLDIPIVVHCSAGCGRTGTIIAIDFARALLITKDLSEDLNVFSIVHDMRKQRPSMVQAKEQYVFVYIAIAELIKRILGNVPQAPPKQLNFERREEESFSQPSFNDDNIYMNVQDMNKQQEATVALSEKRKSTGSIEQVSSPVRSAPPFPPKPLARSSSAGRTESTGDSSSTNKPLPPVKPPKPKPLSAKPVKPEKPETIDTPKKDLLQPEPAPRPLPRKTESAPVPAPRRNSPIPPTCSTPTPPTSTPVNKGYVNVPGSSSNGSGGIQTEDTTYSVVQKTSTLPSSGRSSSSTKPSKTSNSSILDMLMIECGDVLSESDRNEISGSSGGHESSANNTAQDMSYSLLDTVNEDELPPDIPVKTLESTQFVIGEEGSPTKDKDAMLVKQPSVIYETPDPSLITQPQPTSLAFSPSSNSGSQDDLSAKQKKGRTTGGLFKKGSKEKYRSTEDVKTVSHSALGRTTSSGLSPTKWSSQSMPMRRAPANDRFHFPGEMGFGIRVGKPKGPRAIPSHWSIPNGLLH